MIYVDQAQRDLDKAAAKYRRAYNRGYAMSERGDHERAQALLDKANAEYDAAKAKFAAQGGSGKHGNTEAREGCDRCYCGCKYWENDRCVDCGTSVAECLRDADWVAENRTTV